MYHYYYIFDIVKYISYSSIFIFSSYGLYYISPYNTKYNELKNDLYYKKINKKINNSQYCNELYKILFQYYPLKYNIFNKKNFIIECNKKL